MRNANVIVIVAAAAVAGGFGGYKLHSYLWSKHTATLAIGQFSTRLMEDSTSLTMLRQKRVDCLEKDLQSRVTSHIEEAKFFRSLPYSDKDDLARLERAVQFGYEQIKFDNLSTAPKNAQCN